MTVLDQAYGYGFAVGLGAGFCLLMMGITYMLSRYMNEQQNTEHFSTASRSVKAGLLANGVVSSWCWPGTLLTSSTYAYRYGVGGGFIYGTIGVIHVILFTALAIEIKRIAPGAHTVSEIVRGRFGRKAHVISATYSLCVNVIVSSMLLLGAVQSMHVLTGTHVVALAFLLPIFVAIYTTAGGIKATLYSDLIHTAIIFVVVIVAMFVAYTTSSHVGSIDRMYDLLTEMGKEHPSTGHEGSYLTFRNRDMIMTMWSQMFSSFVTVFADPSYAQKAISGDALSTLTGYVTGALVWFILPLGLSLSTGLVALAVTNDPVSVTYPEVLSKHLVNEGMPMLYGLTALMGKAGAAAGLLILFMSCTSAISAELIAFSSVMTFDLYRDAINPKATGHQLIRVSHCVVLVYGLVISGLTIMFNYIGITISWILTFMGIIFGPAFVVIIMTLFWKRMSVYCFYIGMPLGSLTGLACWLGAAHHFYNAVNKDTLGQVDATIIGNFVASGSSLIYFVLLSLWRPQNYDFSELKGHFTAAGDATEEERERMVVSRELDAKLKRASRVAWVLTLLISIGMAIVFILTLYGTGYIFSKPFFRGWIVVFMVWLLVAFLYITFYPLYESRDAIALFVRRVLGRAPLPERVEHGEEDKMNVRVSVKAE